MRTQLLLATAALAALGAFSASAQVYSVNAVGYVNVSVPAGAGKFALVANQLNASPNNAVSNIFAGVPEGTLVYSWGGASFTISTFEFGEWSNGQIQVGPGTGAFLRNPGATALAVTFVGEVPQGQLDTAYPSGFSLLSSKVPQGGALQAVLGFTPKESDIVYKWNTTDQKYDLFTYEFGEWSPSAPAFAVGEGFFLKTSGAGTWSRNFSVNN
jgi:hypothetical protein